MNIEITGLNDTCAFHGISLTVESNDSHVAYFKHALCGSNHSDCIPYATPILPISVTRLDIENNCDNILDIAFGEGTLPLSVTEIVVSGMVRFIDTLQQPHITTARINGPIDISTLPNLHTLCISGSSNGIVFPNNIKRLILTSDFPAHLVYPKLPDSIEELHIHSTCFAEISNIPLNLKSLLLESKDLDIIDKMVLPRSFENLLLKSYPSDLKKGSIPDCISSLILSGTIPKISDSLSETNLRELHILGPIPSALSCGDLPLDLRVFTITMSDDESFDYSIFPENLRELHIEGSYKSEFELAKLGSNLEYLSICDGIPGNMDLGLPENLKELVLGNGFEGKINPGSLPKTLRTLMANCECLTPFDSYDVDCLYPICRGEYDCAIKLGHVAESRSYKVVDIVTNESCASTKIYKLMKTNDDQYRSNVILSVDDYIKVRTELIQTEDKLSIAHKKIAELENSFANSNQLVDELKDELEESKNSIDELHDDLSESQDKIDELQDDLIASNSRLHSCFEKTIKLCGELEKKEKHIESLNETVAKLNQELEDSDDKINELRGNADETANELRDSRKRVEKLKIKLEKHKKHGRTLTKKMNKIVDILNQ